MKIRLTLDVDWKWREEAGEGGDDCEICREEDSSGSEEKEPSIGFAATEEVLRRGRRA